jgi:hypothetical protein
VIILIIIKILFIIGKKDKWFNSTSTSIVKENLINTADDDIPVVAKVNSKSRLYFLDNIKAFVTFIVVCHHVGCSFGACGPNTWYLIIGIYLCIYKYSIYVSMYLTLYLYIYLIIGSYDSYFNAIVRSFVILNQGYFMCLFFFISAYFTPNSYDRKGFDDFHYDKAKRLGIPLILYNIILGPICVFIGLVVANNSLIYFLNYGPW